MRIKWSQVCFSKMALEELINPHEQLSITLTDIRGQAVEIWTTLFSFSFCFLTILIEVGQFTLYAMSANRLDSEQEREQEHEQKKEVEARRDQQVEVEKFVDRE